MMDFLRSRFRSFIYAWAGIMYLVKTQKNAWIHAAVSCLVVIVGLWLSISAVSWAVIILTLAIVWSAEAINTAIEAVIDLVSPQHHPLAKISKDLGAASVLITAIASVLIGLLIMGPPLLQKLGW